ncbi:NAD-dependent epimerase [Desulfoluna limicola]|uniref:NAD-dependent epimerase n=1 Tax=Desulfoluna limicola TaxID=2810562 RepID=A0ABN6EYK7_9BACT|nr:SDR family oxidoreductase [Desulfoluna limicola]BCS94739.1 NAD-dependent epimerase [Desulfoluna limicola]
MDERPLILLTGATGYVGARLLRVLEGEGFRLRCMARRAAFLKQRTAEGTDVMKGDVFDLKSLALALEGVHTAFYLIHSMGATGGFEEMDRKAAHNFAKAAQQAGVKKIIYLGGLGEGAELSAHLRSRQEVGRILRESSVPTLEFRASIIIGSGSLSFELVRALTERLPVMLLPKWVKVLAQPIGIEDVIRYLTEAVGLPLSESRIVEVGGSEPLSYQDLMETYAKARGFTRLMIPVPVLTPAVSSLWLGLVTPLYARVGRKLIEGVKNKTVVKDPVARELFTVEPMSAREAIQRALMNEERAFAESRWTDAVSSAGGKPPGPETAWMGTRYIDQRTRRVNATPGRAFSSIARIGGRNGWYAFNFLWQIRGAFDLMVGGVGVRRGRPHRRDLRSGDHLDFWRVERFEEKQLLRLISEMKLPGKAWLEFEVKTNKGRVEIHQTAIFYPSGFMGRLYWLAVLPFHAFVFQGMIRNMVRWAEEETDSPFIKERRRWGRFKR